MFKKIDTHIFNLLLDWSASNFQIVPELGEGVQLKDLSQVMPLYDGDQYAGHLRDEELKALMILKDYFLKGHLPGLNDGTAFASLVVEALHRDQQYVRGNLKCTKTKLTYEDRSSSLSPDQCHDILLNIYRALSLVSARAAILDEGRGVSNM